MCYNPLQLILVFVAKLSLFYKPGESLRIKNYAFRERAIVQLDLVRKRHKEVLNRKFEVVIRINSALPDAPRWSNKDTNT